MGKSHNWTTIIRDLFAGKVTQEGAGQGLYQIPQRLQESILNRLAAPGRGDATTNRAGPQRLWRARRYRLEVRRRLGAHTDDRQSLS